MLPLPVREFGTQLFPQLGSDFAAVLRRVFDLIVCLVTLWRQSSHISAHASATGVRKTPEPVPFPKKIDIQFKTAVSGQRGKVYPLHRVMELTVSGKVKHSHYFQEHFSRLW